MDLVTTPAAQPVSPLAEPAPPVAQVRRLTVSYRSGKQWVPVLADVDLAVAPGETVAVVGESGCGKSTLAAALVGHLRAGSRISRGDVLVQGRDLFAVDPAELRRIRSSAVAFVPQNAGHGLTPSMRVGDQIMEVLRFGQGLDKGAARAEAARLFGLVRLPQPEVLLERYPHQLSGGQLQRVAIAIGIAGSPRLLVLDEPTTGLDVVTQAGILDLLADLRRDLGVAVVLVSHDLGAVARLCDRMLVMYSGKVVEAGRTADLFARPAHPYTRGLLASVPRIAADGIPVGMPGGSPASPGLLPGCSFAPRCDFAAPACTAGPGPALLDLPQPAGDRSAACLRSEHVLAQPEWAAQTLPRAPRDVGPVLLEITGLQVDYRSRPDPTTGATVEGIDLQVRQGEVVALVGESGSGKSTIAWTIAGLRRPSAGTLTLHPRSGTGGARADVGLPAAKRAPQWRRQIQLIFQNADTALNPRRTVGDAVTRPLRLLGLRPGPARERRDAVFADVGLPPSFADRLPAQLSGGQRQRAGIARALAADPALLLADEVVSALDVSVQASVLALLDDLRAQHHLGYLFIAHDLAVVRGLADRVVVLYLGRICEEGTVEEVFGPVGTGAVNHPYTRLLLDSVMDPAPQPDRDGATVDRRHASVRPGNDEPESAPPPAGCAFYRRCAHRIENVCNSGTPPLRTTSESHRIRCHLPLADLASSPVGAEVSG